ncbi:MULTISPECIES: serine protease [Nostoc]|uniref:Tetratricopeptide repeat protein n=1 Tax=Nostoc paludosum FACHB-159 TaxID=2692908 RepID=A0ABR8K292_9NOSO|nr:MULTISPECIES: serine protease [Nostoc]MBD2677311.1 tetratricopeptide repeat protein [Nostoc sp. FACHB-857]MBD2732879.1 tetratricopeptide repeat protein [Nostoc paludosum FACHB-159]
MNHYQKIIIAILSSLFIFPTAYVAKSQPVPNKATSVLANNSLSLEQIRQIGQAVTVKVLSNNKGGSGVLISKQGQIYTILTSAHVISSKGTYRIQTPDGKTYTATVITQGNSLKGNDLAVLQFQSQANYQIIPLASNSNLVENQEVLAAGFPDDSKELVITDGKISLLSEQPLVGGYQIGYTNEIKQGMSGGALLNLSGQLIGINGLLNNAILNEAYYYQDGTKPSAEQLKKLIQLSFAVPIQTLAKVAPNLAIIPPEWRNQQQAQKSSVGNTFVDKVNNIAEQITVRIDSKNHGNGSGVIIAKQGQTYYVVTARHVVENPDNYKITTPDGKGYAVQAENIVKAEGLDVALVKFTSNQTYSVATIAKYNLYSSYSKKRWIFISGFAEKLGGKSKFTAGLLSNPERVFARAESLDYLNFVIDLGYQLTYSNLTQPGMSGGPVLDVMGQVIGINTGSEGKISHEFELGLGLGVPSNSILDIAIKSGLKPEVLKIATKAPPRLTETQVNLLQNHPLLIAQKPQENASEYDWLNYGNQLWRLEKYTQSVAALQQAIKLKPDFYQAYYALAASLYSEDKFPEALAAIEQAIKIQPENDESWSLKSDILKYLKNYSESLAAIDKAIEYNDGNLNYYVTRSMRLDDLKRYSEALAPINKAIQIKPLYNYYSWRSFLRIRLKDYQGALADANQVIELQPDYVHAYSNKYLVHFQLQDYHQALVDINKVIQLQPAYVLNYDFRSSVRFHLKDYQGALADCNQAIEIDPGDATGYMCRGFVRTLGLPNLQAALADYDRAIKLEPDNSQNYFYRGSARSVFKDYQGALPDFDRAIKLDPNNAPAYISRAGVRSELKDYQGALADYDRAIKLDSTLEILTLAYTYRGDLRNKLNDIKGALADYTKAIELQPNNAKTYVSQGNVNLKLNDLNGALADANQAIKLQPDNAEAYILRGGVRYKLNDVQGALIDLSKGLELHPEDAKLYAATYAVRGDIRAQLKDYQGALSDYNQVIKLQPDNLNGYSFRGRLRSQLKDYQGALSDYTLVLKIQPNNAEAYLLRGEVYVQLKDYPAALSNFNQAIKLQPNNPQAYFGRGVIYQKQGNDRAALSDYNQALAQNEKLAAAIINIGYIKYETGDIEGAIQQWEKAVQINGELPEPQMALAVALYAKGEQQKALNIAQAALRLDKSWADVEVLKENLWGTHLVDEARKLLASPSIQAFVKQ